MKDRTKKLIRETKNVRSISIPRRPISHSGLDIYPHFEHFCNVIHLRYVSQIDLMEHCLKIKHPEVFSVVRNITETVAALIYVYTKVKDNYAAENYDECSDILFKSTMGAKSEAAYGVIPGSRDTKIPIIPHIMNYIREVDKILKKSGDNIKIKNFEMQYATLSEYTHPNSSGLGLYWERDRSTKNFGYKNSWAVDLKQLESFILINLMLYKFFGTETIKFTEKLRKNQGIFLDIRGNPL